MECHRNFSIICASDDRLDFKYDGTKPTEAIRINKWVDVTFVNDSGIDRKVIRQHIKVEVLSVLSLIEEYQKTLKEPSNLSVSPEIYYSRSGEFIFEAFSKLNGASTLKYFIFFEEPQVNPSFINKYEQNEGLDVTAADSYFVSCRSTRYVQPPGWGEPELWIKSAEGKKREETAIYDPTAGFNVSSSQYENQSIPADTKFLCIIPHQTDLSKNVTFDATFNESAQRPLQAVSQESSMIHMWSYFSREGKFNARCTPRGPTLNFIAARNPDEQVLVRDFVLPDFVNGSLHVEIGKPSDEGRRFGGGAETHRGTSLHFGELYCAAAQGYNSRSFVTDIEGRSSFLGLGHSIDWRRVVGEDRDGSWPENKLPSQADPELYFELKNTDEGGSVYDFENLTLQCRVHPFFSRPVVWQLQQNNAVIRHVEKDALVGPSILTTQLKPGLANISCLASLWGWPDRWARITTNVTVIASKEPKFEEGQLLIYELAPDALNPHFKLKAKGVPSPSITCSEVFLNDNETNIKQAQATPTKVLEEMRNSTEATFRITALRETELNCEAKNGRGVDNITINIRIKSNRSANCTSGSGEYKSGAGRMYDMYGLSFVPGKPPTQYNTMACHSWGLVSAGH